MTEQCTQPPAPFQYEIVELDNGQTQHWFKLPGNSVFIFEDGEIGTAYAWSSRLPFDETYEAWESAWAQSAAMEACCLQKSQVGFRGSRTAIDDRRDLVKKYINDNNNPALTAYRPSCSWWRKDYTDGTSIKWHTDDNPVAEGILGSLEYNPGALAEDSLLLVLLQATATQEIVDNADELLHS